MTSTTVQKTYATVNIGKIAPIRKFSAVTAIFPNLPGLSNDFR